MSEPTHFETFVRAVENAGDRFGVLGDDALIIPPDPDYGYASTPRNAVTFSAMGVDGVHYAILKIDGAVTDESPVIHVSPMDFSQPYAVLGESFLGYLAVACGVSAGEMASVLEEERAHGGKLVPFLRECFDDSRLYDDARLRALDPLLRFVDPKPEQ